MKVEEYLTKLGLPKNAALVYLALLKAGSVKAQPLIQATGLHRMLVYNALEDLAARGLVTITHQNRVRIFHAQDPSLLIAHTKKLQELAESVVPELRDLQRNTSETISVRTLIGHEGFRVNLENIIESASKQKNREIYIIGGAKDTDFYDATDGWYPQYISLSEKKKIKKRLLAPASYSSEFKKKFASEKNTELRTLSKGLSSPTYTRITKEMVSIEIYKPHLTIIQIKNPTVAQAYLDSFNILWETSGKY
ncbi:MAG: helix-turn-helix domain-containing protein [Patescibacteria group bacterium]